MGDARLGHPGLRINRALRVMLQTRLHPQQAPRESRNKTNADTIRSAPVASKSLDRRVVCAVAEMRHCCVRSISVSGVAVMRISGRMLLALVVLASLGCASSATESSSSPPVDVSGGWTGTLILGPLTLIRCCGGTSGAARIDFEQDGTTVTGSLEAPGIRGTIDGSVRGATIRGSFRYRAGMSAGTWRFDATVDGNEMLATTLDSKLILSRVR